MVCGILVVCGGLSKTRCAAICLPEMQAHPSSGRPGHLLPLSLVKGSYESVKSCRYRELVTACELDLFLRGQPSPGMRPNVPSLLSQCCASRIRTSYFRERTLLPSLSLSACALLRPQSGPQAGAWLTVRFRPKQLRRLLRLPLPVSARRCGPPGCGGEVDAFGDHALACTRTGLIARRAKIVERAWVRVTRDRMGKWSPDSGWRTQQHLTRSDDRRRLDLVVYGATCLGGALHVLRRHTRSAAHGAGLRVAERRKRAAYPEVNGGPQQLVVLGSEVGGPWNANAQLVRDLAVPVPSKLRQPCEAPLRRHGPVVGGPCWPCRSNKPSRAQPSRPRGRRSSPAKLGPTLSAVISLPLAAPVTRVMTPAAGSAPKQCSSCASSPAIARTPFQPTCDRPPSRPVPPAGPDCSPLRPSAPTPPHSSSCPPQPSWAKDPCPICMRSSPMRAGTDASCAPAAAGPA